MDSLLHKMQHWSMFHYTIKKALPPYTVASSSVTHFLEFSESILCMQDMLLSKQKPYFTEPLKRYFLVRALSILESNFLHSFSSTMDLVKKSLQFKVYVFYSLVYTFRKIYVWADIKLGKFHQAISNWKQGVSMDTAKQPFLPPLLPLSLNQSQCLCRKLMCCPSSQRPSAPSVLPQPTLKSSLPHSSTMQCCYVTSLSMFSMFLFPHSNAIFTVSSN